MGINWDDLTHILEMEFIPRTGADRWDISPAPEVGLMASDALGHAISVPALVLREPGVGRFLKKLGDVLGDATGHPTDGMDWDVMMAPRDEDSIAIVFPTGHGELGAQPTIPGLDT